MTSPIVYLDNNATTQVAPEVVVAMQPFFTEHWGNPSSMHAFGGRVAADVEKARAQVASFLGCAPAEIVFTSCATESDNAAINGIVETLGPQTRIITSRVEHPAVLGPCRHLREKGHQVVEIGVDSKITVEEGHRIAEEVHDRIEKEFSKVKHVMVHVNPF